jgi:hypothetical protein
VHFVIATLNVISEITTLPAQKANSTLGIPSKSDGTCFEKHSRNMKTCLADSECAYEFG